MFYYGHSNRRTEVLLKICRNSYSAFFFNAGILKNLGPVNKFCSRNFQVKFGRIFIITLRPSGQEVMYLGQHFLDISKKKDVNQSLLSLMNDNY
jgi:hypothetical protein